MQDDNSSNFVLTVDLGELELLTHNRNNVVPKVVPDHMIRSSCQLTNDDDLSMMSLMRMIRWRIMLMKNLVTMIVKLIRNLPVTNT